MFLHCQRWAPALLLALAGCASTPPSAPARLGLKLAPQALGATVSVQQHLVVERAGASTNSMRRWKWNRRISTWWDWHSASVYCRSITTARR